MSNLLEQLLLEAGTLNAEVEKKAKQNQEDVLKHTIKEEVRKVFTEALAEEDDDDSDMDYEETSVNADTGVEVGSDDVDTDMDDAASGAEDSDEAGEEDAEGDIDVPEMDDDAEMPIDVDAGMDAEMGGEEEVMDLTNATEEEVLQVLKDLPDDATIEIVKKPAFDVNVSTSEDMGMDSEEDMGMDETMDEMMNEMMKETMDESKEDIPFDNGVADVEKSKGGENAPFGHAGKKAMNEMEMDEACADKSVYGEELNEAKESNAKLVSEMKKMKRQMNALVSENKKLKANQDKAVTMLKESMEKMKALALTNTNLAYVSQLFTEHSTTRKEKETILEKFDSAKTVGESEIMFNMLKESLENRVVKNNKTRKITESINKQTKVIKEEAVYVDPKQSRLLEIMNYKPKA